MPAVPENAAPTALVPVERHTGLDGLRGLAAVVVVVMHCMLVSPVLAQLYQRSPVPDALMGWWLYSPLHLLWAGQEAVTVFFVLSGFVLTLPYLDARRRPSWRAYYPQRLVRLYLPVCASLLLAAATYAVVDHDRRPGISWWMAGHAVAATPDVLLHDGALVLGAGYVNSVLWSLRYEVLFSLALPLVVWLVVRAGRWRLVLAVLCLLVTGATAALDVQGVFYLPMFGVGAAMAADRVRLAALAARMGGRSWTAVLAVAVALLLAKWWYGVHVPFDVALVTLGAALLVGAFLWCPAAVALGRLRGVQWIGVRSFSLYLVHEPLVVSTAFVLHVDDPVVLLAVAGPVSLLVTAVFYRLVERPSHLLAKRVGRSLVHPRERQPLRRDPHPASAAPTLNPLH